MNVCQVEDRFDLTSLSEASTAVPAEGEINVCQVEDRFVLR